MAKRSAGWTRGLFAVAALLLSTAAAAQAQGKFPPDSLRNVQAMPEGTSVKQVVEAMRGFTRALGVRCTYCHVGTESQPLEAIDFVADTKAAKKNARAMLRMTQAINDEQLPRLVERIEPHVAVTCATCHRGVTRPRSLTDEILGAYAKGGSDAAAARFRELRQRYYGRAAYDFGDVSLSEAANTLHEQGDMPGALKLLELNVELLPESWFGHWRLAEMRAAAGQTEAAIAALERAIALQSRPDLVERLEALKKQSAAERAASDKPRP
jgi:tetratricopeptide (TPR) repeat protein